MTLLRWRTKNALTQEQTGKRLGISQVFVGQIENGSRDVSLPMGLEIERRLFPDVKAEDLPMSAENRKALRRLRVQMKTLRAS